MNQLSHNRRGFTVVELMVATFIIALVMGGLCTFMVSSHRLVKGAYAEAELSLQLRTLREKLLFHVAPPHGSNVWAGVLSGTNATAVVENSMKVRMFANGISLANGKACPQTIELLARTETTQDGTVNRWLGNDGDRYDDQWQRPYLRQVSNYLPTYWLNDSQIVNDRYIFFITLSATMNGYSRNERLAVPVFGKQQVRTEGGVFHGE